MKRLYKEASIAPTENGFAILLDGKSTIELDDSHLAGSGAVGVWTKADSVTAFDDFAYGPPAK